VERYLHKDEISTAATTDIMMEDSPIDGPLFSNMQECLDMEMPKLNADSFEQLSQEP
jgi:hypothetical protein